ncbi:MAG: lysophospholipase [Ectothiorhodospiraceae bacterium]|nr:lysophospholipase [Ectothiorhodospiraceae bacterium]
MLGTLLGIAACGKPAVQESGDASQAARLEADAAYMPDGTRLPIRRWVPEQEALAVVLALHGFNDYSKSFDQLAHTLTADGILVYAYDQRGFGDTENRGIWAGANRLIEDARTVTGLLREAHPDKPLYILGKSMGGAVTLAGLARDPIPDVDGAVMVAPAVWARSTMPWYQRAALWVGNKVAPGRKVTGRGLGIRPTDNIPMLREWGRDPLIIRETRIDAVHGLTNLMDEALAATHHLSVPSLILYGEHDQIVPRRPTCRMLSQLPDNGIWRFALYQDGYHMLTRDLQAEVVHADIVAWLLDRNGQLPSGQEQRMEARTSRFCEQKPETEEREDTYPPIVG